MSILAWVLLGLLAGAIARALVPGRQPVGLVLTTAVGVLGALLGGLVARWLGIGDPIDEFFDLSTWLAAIAGAAGLLVLFQAARR